jgi:uncharacterized protein YyaL (SSP411 family)
MPSYEDKATMTDSPTQADRSPNRLITEASPYLRQHAKNPVDWYPWGKEALSQARAEDKPILLSIGYSACHWCHVMAHECFENVEIAGLMNRDCINVKVDREERLDLDDLYQKSAQVFLGRGGEIVELTNHHGRSVRCGLATYVSKTTRNGCRGPIAAGCLVRGKNLRTSAHRKKEPSATGING